MIRTRRLLRAPGAVPLFLTAVCFSVAFAQRPGRAFTDSRIELSIAPARFLSDVTHIWSSSGDLGHVQGGLFAGYLVPMAPWYALADRLGLAPWLAQRLLLGLILTLAAWGVVRLMDALWGPRGTAHLAAGALYALSPYVVVSLATRGSVPLLAYAALPWLFLAVHRGLADPRRWLWPALAAVAIALSGGAITSANIAWMLAGALALGVYEVAVLGRPRGALWSFGWRAALLVVLLSAWWLVPLALQGAEGADFQQFTEQQGTIWATTSLAESLRQLGFWVMYLGAGFGTRAPQLGIGADYLFDPLVIVASFAVPLLAFGGLLATRRWRYAPFFGLLAVGALLVMAAGFPPGTPLRRTLIFASEHSRTLEIIRTTYKAAPLLSLSVACLGGAATAALFERFGASGVRRVALGAGLVAVLALASLPLVAGRAIDKQVAYDEVPAAWRQAVPESTRAAGANRRVLVAPGHVLAYYRWGYTSYSVAPPLSDRPVAIRELTRYADPRSAQLFDATDRRIQQERLVPGQLSPLLRALAVGQLLVPSDSNVSQSGSLPPAGVPDALAGQPGFGLPAARFGRERRFAPLSGRSGAPRRLPEIRRYAVPGTAAGLVRLQPAAGGAVLDGDADGVVELAAHGALDSRAPLFYAGDVGSARLRELARRGAELVFTDSGRRRVVSSARLRNDLGPTLGPTDPISGDSPTYESFPGSPASHRTVARYSGLEYLRSPRPPDVLQFPERRPYAALDGRLDTPWLAESREKEDRYLELALERPRRVGSIRVYPHMDSASATARLAVSVNGGGERALDVHRGWNRIPVGATLRTLRVRIARAETPKGDDLGGGLDELRIPGLRVREWLETPTGLARAARGLDLSHAPMSVLLERTTADFPYRAGRDVGAAERLRAIDMVDAEPGLERLVSLPAGRSFAASGWASAAPAAGDSVFDALTGVPDDWRFTSSSRFEGVPGRRASSAFDGDRASAWIGDDVPGRAPWLSLRAPRPFSVDRLRLRQDRPRYRRITRVRVEGDSGGAQQARVARDGAVRLGRPIRTRTLRVEALATSRPRGSAVRAVAVTELTLPGLRPPVPRRTGRFRSSCGELTLRAGASRATAVVAGSVRDLDAGRALRLAGCGPRARLALPAGQSRLSAPPGTAFRPDHVRLSAPAPRPLAAPVEAGTVVHPGHGRDGRRDDVRLRVNAPGWLVLAESYSRDWRAWCRSPGGRERELGEPVPIDGFANGWRVGPGCREARMEFVPQRTALAGYAVSGLAALVLMTLGLVALLRRRPRPAPAAADLPGQVPPDRALVLPWGPALAVGAAVALAGGFLFALRAGVVLGPAAVVLLRAGLSTRRLVALAAAGLVVIPLLYLVFPADDRGGFNFSFAIDNLAAHWVAVVVVCCLGVACALDAGALRRLYARRR